MKTASSPPTVLLVEDDSTLERVLTGYFEARGYRVTAAAAIHEAMAAFRRERSWTLVISDCNLPDGNGWDFCCWIREQRGSAPPFLLMSGNCSGGMFPGVDFLAKPFGVSELNAKVAALVDSPTPLMDVSPPDQP